MPGLYRKDLGRRSGFLGYDIIRGLIEKNLVMSSGKKSDRKDTTTPSRRSIVISSLVVIGLSLAGLGLLEIFGGLDRFIRIVKDAGPWAPVMFILLKTLSYVIAPLSGAPLKIAAGALFGFWPAFLYVSLGDTLGGTLNYWVARGLGRPAIAKLTGPKSLNEVEVLRKSVGNTRALIFSRIVLSPIYDFISYAAGLMKVPFSVFVAVTAVGGVIPIALSVGLGALYEKNPILLVVIYGTLAILVWLTLSLWKKRHHSKTN